jgi:hypothetical protein
MRTNKEEMPMQIYYCTNITRKFLSEGKFFIQRLISEWHERKRKYRGASAFSIPLSATGSRDHNSPNQASPVICKFRLPVHFAVSMEANIRATLPQMFYHLTVLCQKTLCIHAEVWHMYRYSYADEQLRLNFKMDHKKFDWVRGQLALRKIF